MENIKEYTKEEVVAYAMWTLNVIFSSNKIKQNEKLEVFAAYRKEITALMKYDKDNKRALSILKNIDNMK